MTVHADAGTPRDLSAEARAILDEAAREPVRVDGREIKCYRRNAVPAYTWPLATAVDGDAAEAIAYAVNHFCRVERERDEARAWLAQVRTDRWIELAAERDALRQERDALTAEVARLKAILDAHDQSTMIRAAMAAGRGIGRASVEIDAFTLTETGKAMEAAQNQILDELMEEAIVSNVWRELAAAAPLEVLRRIGPQISYGQSVINVVCSMDDIPNPADLSLACDQIRANLARLEMP